jgi:2-phospho-L-lactate transferase/gluconeogenesis factor (CofD/UPF0052 family)
MKKLLLFVSIITAIGFVKALPLYAQVDVNQAIVEHEKMISQYEEQAKAQDAVIVEHQKMKQDYKNRFYVNDKVTPTSGLKEMETHCNTLISEAQKMKADLLDFAKWHRSRNAELQGK